MPEDNLTRPGESTQPNSPLRERLIWALIVGFMSAVNMACAQGGHWEAVALAVALAVIIAILAVISRLR
jgi:pheromone shutdown protein TraB